MMCNEGKRRGRGILVLLNLTLLFSTRLMGFSSLGACVKRGMKVHFDWVLEILIWSAGVRSEDWVGIEWEEMEGVEWK